MGSLDKTAVGVTITRQNRTQTANFSTTSTTFVDVTDYNLTLATRVGGLFFASVNGVYSNNASTASLMRIVEGSTNHAGTQVNSIAGSKTEISRSLTGVLDGDLLKVQIRTTSGTYSIFGESAQDRQSIIEVIEIS